MQADIRSGYLNTTAYSFDREGAIQDAKEGLLHQFPYNAETQKFEDGDNYGILATYNADGTVSLTPEADLGMYIYPVSWTNEQGKTFDLVAAG